MPCDTIMRGYKQRLTAVNRKLPMPLARLLMVLLVVSIATTACTRQARDDNFLNETAALLEQVRMGGADEYAPLDVRSARERLVDARAAFDARDFDRAEWMAEQSRVHSELAEAKSRAAQARERSREKRREVDRLRLELLGEEGRS